MKRQTGVVRCNTEKPGAFMGVGLIYLNLCVTVVGTLFMFPTGSKLNFIMCLLPYSLRLGQCKGMFIYNAYSPSDRL